MPTTHKNCQHSNINSLHVVRVAPFWNVLFLYGHCPNCFRSPPLCQTGKRKKNSPNYPGKPFSGQMWEKSASLRLNDISWYDLWNLLCNQMEISQFFFIFGFDYFSTFFADLLPGNCYKQIVFFLSIWTKIFCLNILHFEFLQKGDVTIIAIKITTIIALS